MMIITASMTLRAACPISTLFRTVTKTTTRFVVGFLMSKRRRHSPASLVARCRRLRANWTSLRIISAPAHARPHPRHLRFGDATMVKTHGRAHAPVSIIAFWCQTHSRLSRREERYRRRLICNSQQNRLTFCQLQSFRQHSPAERAFS